MPELRAAPRQTTHPAPIQETGAPSQGSAEALWTALKATGATEAEACVQMWLTGSPEHRVFAVEQAARVLREAMGLPHPQKNSWNGIEAPLRALIDGAPELGNLAFAALGDEGCRMEESRDVSYVVLNDMTGLKVLPKNLQAIGLDLSLENTGIEHLPEGLHVEGELLMEGCANWDGIIPEDAVIGGDIFTDLHRFEMNKHGRHLGGITLQEWRARYGNGSCFEWRNR